MGVTLEKKNVKVSLEKGLEYVLIGLGWKFNGYKGAVEPDLDASAFMLNRHGKVRKDEDFIFYNNKSSEDGALCHMGDARCSDNSDSDQEQIYLDLKKVPADVHKIAITITIHEANVYGHYFGHVNDAYVRLIKQSNPDDETGVEILRYNLANDFSTETAVVVCELFRHGNSWRFNSIGTGYYGGLEALCRNYGVNV